MHTVLSQMRVADPAQRLVRLREFIIPEAEQIVGARECILYALSVGLGARPTDAGHLRYVTEEETRVVPSMVLSLAAPGFWFKTTALGLDWAKLVNVEQSVRLQCSLRIGVRLHSRSRILFITDKGKGRGLLLAWQRDLFDADGDQLAASVTSTVLLRGDGHERGDIMPGEEAHVTGALPARAPDRVIDVATNANSGLLYRLNGTLNPLHADPAVAAAAGFPRPIMPGTASLGFACALLLEHCCGFEPDRLAAFGARLTAPVFPGELLRHELWIGQDDVAFRVTSPERNVTVLDQGRAEIRNGAK